MPNPILIWYDFGINEPNGHDLHQASIKILADSTLPHLNALFEGAFELTVYHNEESLCAGLPFHDILLCRSTLRVTEKHLANTPIQCVATASSGVDHIDTAYLEAHGIKLVDAKGCNAEAVADYVMSTLAWLIKNANMVGKQAGVVGVGEVGSRVVSRLRAAGMDVIQYDPLRARVDPTMQSCTLHDLTTCDLLFIHANLHDTAPFPSKNLVDADFLIQLKPGACLINAARGGIVNEEALLQNTQPLIYCTDVYANERAIDPRIIAFSTLCTPHIAGHSIEAKSRAVETIAHALHAYYGFSMPRMLNLPKPAYSPMLTGEGWSDQALRLYNPMTETTVLKNASDKQAAFLTLRQAHHYRHDFTAYRTTGG